jgi:hypothetical protein
MDIAEVIRLKREDGTLKPAEYNWIKKSQENPRSKSLAIKAMCFHCYGGTKESMPDTGWRQSISTCSAPECPLYAFRPVAQS